MARCGFAVLCHRGPAQLEVLLDRLGGAPVALHIDRRTTDRERVSLEAVGRRAGVEVVGSRATPWASFGLLHASIDCVRALRASPISHVALFTGQDLPLVSIDTQDEFFAAHGDSSFIDHWDVGGPIWGGPTALRRFTWWNVPVRGRRVRVPARRRIPHGHTPIGGSMQWCLARGAFEHVVDVFDNDPAMRSFFRRVWIPDESFVPTVVVNSPHAATTVNHNLWFARWCPGQRHPAVLTEGDGGEIAAAVHRAGPSGQLGALFARKFDLAVDATVVDALDPR